jgi:hypothetical protein
MIALFLAAAVAGATPPANAWDLWGPSSNVKHDGALPSIDHPQSLIPPEALRHAKKRVADLEQAAQRVHEGLGSATCKAPDQDRVVTGKVHHEQVLALVVVRAQDRKPVGALLADSLRFARRIAGCCGGAIFVNAGSELQLESLVAIAWAAEHGLLTNAERELLAGVVAEKGTSRADLIAGWRDEARLLLERFSYWGAVDHPEDKVLSDQDATRELLTRYIRAVEEALDGPPEALQRVVQEIDALMTDEDRAYIAKVQELPRSRTDPLTRAAGPPPQPNVVGRWYVQDNLMASAPAMGRGISGLSTMDSFSPEVLRVLKEKGRPRKAFVEKPRGRKPPSP